MIMRREKVSKADIAVKGYYNEKQIVMNEDVKLAAGQEVIVTILEM